MYEKYWHYCYKKDNQDSQDKNACVCVLIRAWLLLYVGVVDRPSHMENYKFIL